MINASPGARVRFKGVKTEGTLSIVPSQARVSGYWVGVIWDSHPFFMDWVDPLNIQVIKNSPHRRGA